MKNTYLLILLLLSFTTYINAQYQDTVWIPKPPDTLAKPNYLQTVHDSTFNVDIKLISDTSFGFAFGTSELLPPYAKVQAWNSDMSKILIGYTNLIDGTNYTFTKKLFSGYGGYPADARWSNTDPNIRYFCYHDMFLKINIVTDKVDTLHAFPGYTARVGPWEGNIDKNDKYVVITDVGAKKATLYDIKLDSIISTKTFTGVGFDWASITPSGNYIVVSSRITNNFEVYDLNFNFLRNLGPQQHADFAIDMDGNEVLVQVIPLSMTRLDNGQKTDLIRDALVCGNYHYNPNIAGHISGRNFGLPGWALVSTSIHLCTDGVNYNYITEMFAIKLDTSQTIRPFGHSHSKFTTYTNYAKASFSPDGKRVMFSSDWDLYGQGTPYTLAYVAEYKGINLSLDELKKNPKISIYPNPVKDKFTLKTDLKNQYNLTIYSLAGKKIKSITNINEKEFQISTPNLKPGIYFVQIISSEGYSFTKKIIITE